MRRLFSNKKHEGGFLCRLFSGASSESTFPGALHAPSKTHFGEVLGVLHKRAWKAQHIENIVKKCGRNEKKWILTLQEVSKQGKSSFAKVILDRMALLGMKLKSIHVQYLLDSCIISKNVAVAVKCLQQCSSKIKLPRSTYLQALRVCASTGDPKAAAVLVELMNSQGLEVCSSVILSQMSAYAEAGDLEGVVRSLANKLEGLHHLPNPMRFSESSIELLKHLMQSKNISLMEYNILLKACARSSNFEMARNIFSSFSSNNISPDSHSWGSLVKAAVASDRANEGLTVLRDAISKRDVNISSPYPFNHLLASFSKSNCLKEFEETFSLMRSSSSPFDNYTYSILLSSVINQFLRPESAVLQDFLSSSAVDESSEIKNASQALSTGAYEIAVESVMQKMLSQGLVPTNHTWRVASAPYCKDLNYAGLRRLIDVVLSKYPQHNKTANDESDWRQLNQFMLRDSLGCLGKLGKGDEAYNLLKKSLSLLQRNGHSSEPRRDEKNCWLRVVRAFAEGENDWRRAESVLGEMRQMGYKITPILWSYVIKTCASQGSTGELAEVSRRMYTLDKILLDERGWSLVIDEVFPDGEMSDANFQVESFFLKTIVDHFPPAQQKFLIASIVRNLEARGYAQRVLVDFVAGCKSLFAAEGVDDLELLGVVRSFGCSSGQREWSMADSSEEPSGQEEPYLQRMKRFAFRNDVSGCFAVYKSLLQQHNASGSSGRSLPRGEIITSDFFDILLGMIHKSKVHVEEASGILLVMREMRVAPMRSVLWHLLHIFEAEGDVSGAIDVADMAESAFQSESLSKSSLEDVVYKVVRIMAADRSPEAKTTVTNFLEKMIFEKKLRSSRLFSALIIERIKQEEDPAAGLEVFYRLVEEADKSLFEANRFSDVAYLTLLDMLIKRKPLAYFERAQMIDTFIKTLLKKEVLSVPTYSLYVDYLIKDRNDIYVYINLLMEMTPVFGQEALILWENLLRKCAIEGIGEEAQYILQRMYDCPDVQPTPECTSQVVIALCKQNNFDEAWDMLQRMGLETHALRSVAEEEGVTNDSDTESLSQCQARYWHPMIDELHRCCKYALLLDVVESMKEANVSPDKHCRLRRLQASLAIRQHEKAINLLEGMVNRKETPDLELFSMLLVFLSENDLPDDIVRVLKLMKSCQLSVDPETWQHVKKTRRFDIIKTTIEKQKNCG